jgi:hypothetical protein
MSHGPRFIPTGDVYFPWPPFTSSPITVLDSDQRRFLYGEWQGYAVAAYFDKEDLYLNMLFRQWAQLFPMDDYNESTDDDERAYIQEQVEKVMYSV